MLIYKPNAEFQQKLDAGEFRLTNLTAKNDGVTFNFDGQLNCRLNLRFDCPVAYENGEEMSELPPLGDAVLHDFSVFSVYGRGYLPPTHLCQDAIISVNGRLIEIKGVRR